MAAKVSMIMRSQVGRSRIQSGVLYGEVRTWRRWFIALRAEWASWLFGMVSGVRGQVMLKEDEYLSLARVTSRSSG